MKEATGASEEDIRAVLQQCNGDPNRATELLLENPFSKVTSKKDRRKAKDEDRRTENVKQDGKRPAGSGGGRGRGRTEGRGGRGSGRGGPPSAGRGNSVPPPYKAQGVGTGAHPPTAANGEAQQTDTWTGSGETWDNQQGVVAQQTGSWGGEETWGAKSGDTWTVSNENNWGSTSAPAASAPAPAQPASAPVAPQAQPAPIRPGVGFADILKGRGTKPPTPPEPAPSKTPAGSTSATAPQSYAPAQAAAPLVEEAPATTQVAPEQPPTAAQPVAQQPYQPISQPQVSSTNAWSTVAAAEPPALGSNVISSNNTSSDNALTTADAPVTAPSTTQYGAYPDETKSSTPGVDSLQLTFGNFSLSSPGLGDFGAGFGGNRAYDMQYQQPEAPAVVSKPAVVAPAHTAETAAPASEQYKPSYQYGLHAAAEKPAATTTTTTIEQTRSSMGLGSSTAHPGAAGYSIQTSQQPQSTTFTPYRLDTFSDSVDTNTQAYGDFGAGFGHEALKQATNTYAPSATSGYAAQTTTSSSSYPTQATNTSGATGGYAPSSGTTSKYAPATGQITGFSQSQGSVAVSETAAAQGAHVLGAASTSATSSSTTAALPVQPPVPPQMHYNPSAIPPGMQAAYGASMYPQAYPTFYPNMAYGMYANYNPYSQGYPQGQSNYPPNTGNTYVSHGAHSGMAPRNYGAHPYSNPTQGAGAGQVAASGYTATPTGGYSLNTSSGGAGSHSSGGAAGYDDISTSGASGAASAYGTKDKDAGGYGMGQQSSGYQAQHVQRGGYAGYGVPNQGYPQSAGNYSMQQQQPYYSAQGYKYNGPPSGHGSNQSNNLKFQ